jgi:hypothetical protein
MYGMVGWVVKTLGRWLDIGEGEGGHGAPCPYAGRGIGLLPSLREGGVEGAPVAAIGAW